MIEVEYPDMNWKKQKLKLDGWTAQICQHEPGSFGGHTDLSREKFTGSDT